MIHDETVKAKELTRLLLMELDTLYPRMRSTHSQEYNLRNGIFSRA